MDQVTQQNAAMVEQSTAAARNMAGETKTLAGLVSFFSVGGVSLPQAPRAMAKQSPAPIRRTAVKPTLRTASAGGGRKVVPSSGDDWHEF